MSFLQDLFKPNVEKLESRSNVQGLIKALGYKEAKVRSDAAEALGRLKDHRAVVALLFATKDKDMDVHRAAAGALVRIGAPAVERLLAMLKLYKNKSDLRQAAAEALVQIGAPAVEPLLAVLQR